MLQMYVKDIIITSGVLVNFIIMLSLGSTESDHVISESCYNEVAYNRHKVK